MATAPPILIWTPGGGVSGGPISNPPVYSQADVTQLVEGQAYIDIVFGAVQTDDQWVLVACEIYNTLDLDPLNIWPGIITDRTTAGFRLQLNGLPDSGNYYLHWAVSGVNIAPYPATLYLFTGPTSGAFDTSVTFTVRLPPSTTLSSPVTVTPDDGGVGGLFSPSSVVLSSGSASATFTYHPTHYGAITLSVTNSGTLIDPANIAFTCVVSFYDLTGPSSGASGTPSTNFTVALPGGGAVVGTVTVTPHDGGGGGTFTPTTVSLSTGAPSATFTYTPASLGAKTISVTNNGGLTNPGSLTYTVTISDGDLISTWPDSSVNGNDLTQTGSARPVYKASILNGKPVVRFVSANSNELELTNTIPGASPWTVFMVAKETNPGVGVLFGLIGPGALAMFMNTDGRIYFGDNVNAYSGANPNTSAWHVLACRMSSQTLFVDGSSVGTALSFPTGAGDFERCGRGGATYSNGDVAELIIYNSELGATNRANIEKYLGTKYAITVAGGSAVQPDTVSGLLGWWKADAL
jgi:hypothetical protein